MPAYTQDGIAIGIIAEGRRSRSGEGQLDHPVMSAKGIVIALAVALVETNLKMYANRSDPESLNFPHDAVGSDANSVGVFQQRAPWWGTVADRMDVARSAAMFYNSLYRQRVGGADYNTDRVSPGTWGQMVQQSAFPDRYDKRMAEARQIYDRLKDRVVGGAPTPPPITAPDPNWRGDPVWLKEVLEAAGLVCHVYDGAYNRGHGDFGEIWGVVAHHTGSFGETPKGIAQHPSLGLASQLYLGRNGEYTLCGVGIAWHAGQGSYPGLPTNDANRLTIGIEAANDGGGSPPGKRDAWSDVQYNAYVRGVAAILRKLGRDSSRVIGHKEWAGTAQGKWDPGGIDMNTFRADVARVMGELGTSTDPVLELLAMPTNQEKLDFIYNEESKKFASRSIYRTPGEGLIDTRAGFVLNVDAMAHQELVDRLAIQYHDSDAIGRIARVAAGQGADPNDTWAKEHALTVLQKIPEEVLKAWQEKNR
ncbi:lysin A [Mycobacterium phage NoodleTree]|uniref:N-acetylmuramoyl-L-alanine amidase n=1 Tax=Mycobacterium phage NoodleTree TaxID=2502470 RepID=A0A411CCV4_9CAUD|nr:endolysin [Mycobacterium phage NoodleTree]QAY11697.1 lysin A [Mycobacterium phage NoodleTree]